VASRGFLTGSIDLVFRWGERWWVADWKSNWLGRRNGQGQVVACGPNDYPRPAPLPGGAAAALHSPKSPLHSPDKPTA
jgi:hypothetical protein